MFQNLPVDSTVWVYQANRKLTQKEIIDIKLSCNEFLSTWDAHGEPMKASTEIFHEFFIVICADENKCKAGGCSLDRLSRLIKNIEEKYSINLFDRMSVAYELNGEIFTTPLHELNALIEQGKITSETIVFNNLIATKKEFESIWKIPLKDSWHARFLN